MREVVADRARRADGGDRVLEDHVIGTVLLDEMRQLIVAGVPETAHPFGGLVYRQALEHLHGVRDEAATRELIVQENRRSARRQLIWFRKEPNLMWFRGPGELAGTVERVAAALDAHFGRGNSHRCEETIR